MMDKIINEITINNARYSWMEGSRPVNEFEGKTIILLTLDELDSLKDVDPSHQLVSIFGEVVLAKDADRDTRFGYVAFGLLENVK